MEMDIKILNERNAQVMADKLGITMKTLERGYGFLIVKDKKFNNVHWKKSVDNELFYNMGKLLTDHQNFVELLSIFGIDKDTQIIYELDVGEIAEVFQHIFEAILSFDDKDRPGKVEGYCIRSEQYCLVAISAEQLDDGCKSSQSYTVIHEYGHYAEQRIIPDNIYIPNQPYNDRDTSFNPALILLSKWDLGVNNENLRMMADELVAWLNAIWISWIVGLDPRTVVLGVVIDEGQKSSKHTKFVKRIFEPLALMICSKKYAAEIFNRCGPHDLSAMSKYKPSEMGDMSLCLQIDHATRVALDQIRGYWVRRLSPTAEN